MKKTVIILSIIIVLILPAVFTFLYSNLWCLLTENGYFIPKESNILRFNATEMNSGSGGWWLYGEDNKYYYCITNADSMMYLKLQKNNEPKCFDKFDYRTWQKITFYNDTLLVNGLQFIKQNDKDTTQFYCMTTIKGDTIIPYADFYHRIELLDINKDGYTDIRVFILSNTPNQCDNYLFDKKYNIFRLVENCGLDIQKINGTDFYYSYSAMGCADMNWESYLSKIEDYQLVDYGRIAGYGCDDELVINIYKVVNDDEFLMEKLLYTKHISNFDDKWNFIKNYWKKNIKNFNKK